MPGIKWCLTSVLLVEICAKEQIIFFLLLTLFPLDDCCAPWMGIINLEFGSEMVLGCFCQVILFPCEFYPLLYVPVWDLLETLYFCSEKDMIPHRPTNYFFNMRLIIPEKPYSTSRSPWEVKNKWQEPRYSGRKLLAKQYWLIDV